GRTDRLLLLSDLDGAAADPRRQAYRARYFDADARVRSAGCSDHARSRLSRFRLHSVVRRVHAGENTARHRAEILRGGEPRVAVAGDAAKAQAACGRSVP